jgi:hypothetical protein
MVNVNSQFGGKGGNSFDDFAAMPIDITKWPLQVTLFLFTLCRLVFDINLCDIVNSSIR